MDDGFDIGFIAVVSVVLLGFAALYLWMWFWRGNSHTGRLRGFRLEEHRRQMVRWLKSSLPMLGVLVLIAADCFLDLCNVSRVRRAYWRGVISTSNLWLVGIIISNTIARSRQARTDREARSNPNMGQSPAEPFSR